MRRSTQVLLVLMGGGMVSAAAVPLLRTPDCDPALAQEGCRTGSSSSRSGWTSSTSFGGGSAAGRSGGADGAASAGVARAGFGGAGAAHASGGG